MQLYLVAICTCPPETNPALLTAFMCLCMQLRPADWHWNIFKQVYNYCACDWSRMHDWPAEQGILYDLLVANAAHPWAKRWQVRFMVRTR